MQSFIIHLSIQLIYSELQGLTLVSLIGVPDPPHDDVPSSIETIRRAGVRAFMVTGDFKLTAVAIARQVTTHQSSVHHETASTCYVGRNHISRAYQLNRRC